MQQVDSSENNLSLYEKEKKLFLENPLKFWEQISTNIFWDKTYDRVLGGTDESPLWFENGKLNICYNAVDRYALDPLTKDKIAFYHETASMEKTNSITYLELYERVCEFSTALKSIGIEKGDIVLIYMPVTLEQIIAMLACVRIGAIHNVVFYGIPAHQLCKKIDLFKPKLLISSNIGLFGEKILLSIDILNDTLKLSCHKFHVVVYQRKDIVSKYSEKVQLQFSSKFLDWSDLVKKATENQLINREYTLVDSNDPFSVIFSTGTSSGDPKPLLRSTAGYVVALSYHLRKTYNLTTKNDVIFSKSNSSWVSGQSIGVYGPLLCGATSLLHEGDLKVPNIGSTWKLVSKFQVNTLHIPPNLIRAMNLLDPKAQYSKQYDISCLKCIVSGSEKIYGSTISYMKQICNAQVYQDYWSTEAGCPMISNPGGIFNIPIDMTGVIVPGNNLLIVNQNGQTVKREEVGELVVKLPIPPNFAFSIYNDHSRYIKSYLSHHPGYFSTGDLAMETKDGFIDVISRAEDCQTINGVSLSITKIESLLYSHPAISECLVIVIKGVEKRDITLGFTTLGSNLSKNDVEKIQKDISSLVEGTFGPSICFKGLLFIDRLPKMQSGKIYRKILHDVFNDISFEIPDSVLENVNVVDELKQVYKVFKANNQ